MKPNNSSTPTGYPEVSGLFRSVKPLKIFGPPASGQADAPAAGQLPKHLSALSTRRLVGAHQDDDHAAGGNLNMITAEEAHMRKVEANDLATNLDELLDAAASGEQFIIVRAGQPVARLMPAFSEFPDRSDLRNSIPPMTESAAVTVRELRDEP